MAYVMGKSEKNTSFQKDSKKNLEYISNIKYENENNKILKSVPTLPRISAPFGSSSVKSTLNNIGISQDPGPGSYDLETSLNKNILLASDNSNKFFITGDSRFKSNDNHVPGVGEYELLNTSSNNIIKNLTPNKISKNTRITSHDFKSPRRIPSIPDRDSKFGFGEDKEGVMEILIDPYINQKFDGTRSNSIGPDRYNTIIIKHNNAIDWKKAAKKTLELSKTKNKTDEFYENYKNKINLTSNTTNTNFDKLNDFYNYMNKTEGNKTNFKNKLNKRLYLNLKNSLTNRSTKTNIYNKSRIYRNDKLGFKDNHDMSYIDLTSVPLKKKNKIVTPGPGAYDPNIGNFNFEQKKNKFQNFGTYESRNLFPIQRMKNHKKNWDDSKIKAKMIINKSLDEKNKLNKFVRSLHSIKVNLLKEQAMKIKKEIGNKIGPGTYSPDTYYNIGNSINVNNISYSYNNTEKKDDRKPIYISINENPGVGEYDVMGEIKKEIDYFLYIKKSKEEKAKNDLRIKMENARKKIRKKKDKKKFIIRKEYKDTEEYKIRQLFISNNYRPAFASAEPKFKEFGSKDDTHIGVGSYNLLYPQKKLGQIKVPFLTGSKKWSNKNFNKNEILSANVGPGSYEQKSFFDWNKKSFNVQYKLK